MRGISLLWGAMLLLAPGFAWAGPADAALTTGIIALDHGDVSRALEKLEAAMADPSQLKAKNVPKGWKALAEARLRAAGTTDAPATTAHLLGGALAAAGYCASDEKYGADCAQVQWQASVALLNAALSGDAEGEPDASATALGAHWPTSWLGDFARGHRALVAKDRAAAARLFDAAAARVLEGAPPAEPLQIVSKLAADRALNTSQMKGPDAAQAELDAFQHRLALRPGVDSYDVDNKMDDAREVVQAVVEALARREAAATGPDATTEARVEWATMLDQMGRFDDATAAWRAAAEGDPGSYEAAYYWGVHHYNRASALQDQDPAAFRAELEAARGPFEAAAALQPRDAALRSTLVSLCAVTGDLACMKTYGAPTE